MRSIKEIFAVCALLVPFAIARAQPSEPILSCVAALRGATAGNNSEPENVSISWDGALGDVPPDSQQISEIRREFSELRQLVRERFKLPEAISIRLNMPRNSTMTQSSLIWIKGSFEGNQLKAFALDKNKIADLAHEFGHLIFALNLPDIIQTRQWSTPFDRILVSAPYAELFADAVAVVYTGDGKYMTNSIAEQDGATQSVGRDFTVMTNPDTWNATEPHAALAPARGYLGKYLMDPRNHDRIEEILWQTQAAIVSTMSDGFLRPDKNLALVNRQLIAQLAKNLADFSP